jgi:hypothetical protein
MDDRPPSGYRYEWCADEGWKIGGDGRKCRMLRCPKPAIAAFERRRRSKKTGGYTWNWWHYCADHMYGRKIKDGVVKFRRLVLEGEGERR